LNRPDGLDQKFILMRQQNNHFAHEIQTLFFLQPLFKPLLIKFILTAKRSDIQVARLRWVTWLRIFVKFSLDVLIFFSVDRLLISILMNYFV
jgi:hypothetical protein